MVESKVVFLGDNNSGKSKLMYKACTSIYYPFQSKNSYSRIYLKVQKINVDLQMYDTAGTKVYRQNIPFYIKGMTVIILVFSLTDENLFNCLNEFYSIVKETLNKMPIVILVGNKGEKYNDSKRVIPYEKCMEKSKELETVYFEVSHETGEGISMLLDFIAQESVKKLCSSIVISSIKCKLNPNYLAKLNITKPCPYMKFGLKNGDYFERFFSTPNNINPTWNESIRLFFVDKEKSVLTVNMYNETIGDTESDQGSDKKPDIKLMDEIEIPIDQCQKVTKFNKDLFIGKGFWNKINIGNISFQLEILNKEPLKNIYNEHKTDKNSKFSPSEQRKSDNVQELKVQEKKKQQKDYEVELEEQRKHYETELEKQRKNYEAELEKQRKEHKDELEKQKNDYEVETRRKMIELESKISREKEEYKAEITAKAEEIKDMQAKIHNLIENHDKEMKKMKEKEPNHQSIKSVNNKLNEIKILDSVYINNLEKIEKIGSGGSGEVYKVAQKHLYALKILKFDKMDISSLRNLFQEYEILSILDHPNIVKTYGIFFSDKDTPASILLEYCPSNLNEAIKKNELNNIQIVTAIYQIVEGMKYVHFQKVIHRDLKPQNILIAEDGTIRIGDFGISKIMTLEEQSMTLGIGTLKFMAPEIVNECNYNEKVDVYSFGVLLFFLLNNGNMPEITIPQIGSGIKAKIPESFTSFAINLINLCWNFDPKDRPSFSDILKMLEENEYSLLPLSEYEHDEIVNFVKKHQSAIPPYSA